MNNQNHTLTLELYSEERIVIESPVPLPELAEWDYAKIVFTTEDYNYVLHNEEIGVGLDRFCLVMNEALENKLLLPYNIKKQDIGYFCNRGMYSWPVIKRIEKSDQLTCFFVWGSPANKKPYLETWIYNDEKGNIVLHVTENFKRDDLKFIKDQKVAYKEFMKNYQPTLIRIIPPEIAREWIKQCSELADSAVANTPKFIEKHNLWTFKINLPDEDEPKKKKRSRKKV